MTGVDTVGRSFALPPRYVLWTDEARDVRYEWWPDAERDLDGVGKLIRAERYEHDGGSTWKPPHDAAANVTLARATQIAHANGCTRQELVC